MTVVICNVLGTMGYVRAFAHFSSVIIAVAALAEPVVASFTAVILNVGVLPGTLAVLWPTMCPEEEVQAALAKTPKMRTPRTSRTPRFTTPRLAQRTLQHFDSIDETKAFQGSRGTLSSRV
eukprot:scaffold2667_cov237-Amphora_coffeaeformis.AAC.4